MLLMLAPAATHAQVEVSAPAAARTEVGQLTGARYRIDIPARWNGELVMYFHGYEVPGELRSKEMRLPRIGSALVARGYAFAQSEYSGQGWVAREAIGETDALRKLVERRLGRPKRRIAIGGSFGGLLALASAERTKGLYNGVLTTCGINAPTGMLADHVLDVLVGFETLFPGVLPTGPDGLAGAGAPIMLDDGASAKITAALRRDAASAAVLARRAEVRPESLPDTIWLYWAVLQDMKVRAGGLPVGEAPALPRECAGSPVARDPAAADGAC
jgi:hypothetical protein